MQSVQLNFKCGHQTVVHNARATQLKGRYVYCPKCNGMQVVVEATKTSAPMSAKATK